MRENDETHGRLFKTSRFVKSLCYYRVLYLKDFIFP